MRQIVKKLVGIIQVRTPQVLLIPAILDLDNLQINKYLSTKHLRFRYRCLRENYGMNS